jgi:hypothetical protein
MPNISRIVPLVCFAVLVAGCSGTTHPSEQHLPSLTPPSTTITTAAASPESAPIVIRTLQPVAKLTGACMLLSAAELKTLLGGGASMTEVTATEDKPDPSGGTTSYTCEYGTSMKRPFALTVLSLDLVTPKEAIDGVVKQIDVKAHGVTGVGTAAVFYTRKDGYSVLVANKRSHGQTRSVIFAAPSVVPEQRFADVTKLVISRV